MAQLALRDYAHEWIMSGCFVLALSAVLLPLLVLFGLKFGIIGNLLDPLKEDPRYREISPSGSGSFGPDWFEAMAARDDVAFVIPRTRSIAATVMLRAPDSEIGRIIDVELIPSAARDPVLAQGQAVPAGYDGVVLSADAAEKLGVVPGATLEGVVSRILRGEQQSERLPLRALGVAAPAAFARDGLFVSMDLLSAVEAYRDGRAVAELGWSGAAARGSDRDYAGFRLYARSLEDVAGLRTEFLRQGVDVRTRVADIELVATLDRNLSIVFWIIAILAVGGYCVSFGASVWANVDRKRREFSVLRLTGFRTHSIVWFPILQALLTGLLGWAIACIAYFVAQGGLNAMFVGNLGGGQPVCRLLPWHLGVTLLLTGIAAVMAAAMGGMRVARLEPSLGLRDA